MKAKFHLEQRLWPIMNLNGKSWVNPPFDCSAMWLDHNEVVYSFTRDYGFYEINLFDVEADALAECNRRNGK